MFELDAGLRELVLCHMLDESAARAEELLELDVADLNTANRCAAVIRKGGATDIVAWQTGTARLLPRLPSVPGCPTGGRPKYSKPTPRTSRVARSRCINCGIRG